MKVLSGAVLLLAFFLTPTQTDKTVILPYLARVTYNETIAPAPNTVRLGQLIEQVVDYAEGRCACLIELASANWVIEVLPYAEFEERVLEVYDQHDPTIADQIRGEQGLIEGLTLRSVSGSQTLFYQWPSDPLLVHELLHVLYSNDPEAVTRGKTGAFVTSNLYKEWLRRNY